MNIGVGVRILRYIHNFFMNIGVTVLINVYNFFQEAFTKKQDIHEYVYNHINDEESLADCEEVLSLMKEFLNMNSINRISIYEAFTNYNMFSNIVRQPNNQDVRHLNEDKVIIEPATTY